MPGPTIIPPESFDPPELPEDLRRRSLRPVVLDGWSSRIARSPGLLVLVSIVPLMMALAATTLATTMTFLALLVVVLA